MPSDLQLPINGATVILNLALAVAVGAGMGLLWLENGISDRSRSGVRSLRRVRLYAVIVAIIAMLALLLFVAASMAEVPVADAGEAVRTMLGESHYGVAWSVGMAALAAAFALAMPGKSHWQRPLALLNLLALAIFLYTRSMVSHAATGGDLSFAMLADWVHLCLISVWIGEVFIAGFFTVGVETTSPADRGEMAKYIENLSTSATVALVGIFATGLLSAWRNLGSIAGLSGNPYGTTLLIKVGLVASAALLGGINRFIVMPSLLNSLHGADNGDIALRRFRMILRIEALVLLAVLVAAAVLSSTSQPAAA